MLLRKLNLAPRSALCFGLFCLMIIAIGLIALQQVDLLNKAETYVETTIVPSIKLLGQLDREFVEIKGNNARLRNPIETPERKAQALMDIQQSRQLIKKHQQALIDLLATDAGREAFEEFAKAQKVNDLAQEQYLQTVANGQLEAAIALSKNQMRAASDGVQVALKKLIALNEIEAYEAGKQADNVYEHTLLIVSVFILIAIGASLALAVLYIGALLELDLLLLHHGLQWKEIVELITGDDSHGDQRQCQNRQAVEGGVAVGFCAIEGIEGSHGICSPIKNSQGTGRVPLCL